MRIVKDGEGAKNGANSSNPPGGGGEGGDFSDDTLKDARQTILDIMHGRAGRGAMTRLMAAKAVLAHDFLHHLTDEDLLAEVNRRRATAGAR